MAERAFNILLVEDDDVAAEAVVRGVRRNGQDWKVVVAEDGLEALDVLRGQHPSKRIARPYMVVVDLNMPRMNGLELIEALRADDELRRSVVFVLTTSSSETDQRRARELGIVGYMVKSGAGPRHAHFVDQIRNFRHAAFPPD
ncbi:MAG: response regulator [Rhodospirillales bacterium]|nr:response regulator [Rhodospirillales bacterium]